MPLNEIMALEVDLSSAFEFLREHRIFFGTVVGTGTKVNDSLHPDYIPSVLLPGKTEAVNPNLSCERYERARKRLARTRQDTPTGSEQQKPETSEGSTTGGIKDETEIIAQLEEEIRNLRRERDFTSSPVANPFSSSSLKGIGLLLLKRWVAGGWCYSKARLDGKTVLITGANTGIGKETAIDLAKRGAQVIIACRNTAKGKSAQADIIQLSGNSNVSVVELDLASLDSIRQCAQKINEEVPRLDILINNAGVMACPRWETKDGFEMQLGTNHLGHFLFTNLLLDLIKKSTPARIINVSSLAHEAGDIYFDDLMLTKDYTAIKSYCQSKLANVLFSSELARRLEGTGVTTYSLHPGGVDTELQRHTGTTWPWARIPWMIFGPFFRTFLFKTAVQGAQTTIYCAVDEKAGQETGLYYSDCSVKKPTAKALDATIAKKLWEVSAELVGLEKKVE